MQRELPEPAVSCHIPNDKESQSTENRQQCCDNQQRGVVRILLHTGIADNVKTGVVKSGHRVEHAQPDCPSQRKICVENGKTADCSHAFNAKCHQQQRAQQLDHTPKGGIVQRFLDEDALPQSDALSGEQHHTDTNGGDSHATHLYQEQQDTLSKGGECFIGGCYCQSHRAHCAEGGKADVQRRERRSVFVSNGQCQQNRPKCNEHCKAKNNDTSRCQGLIPFHLFPFNLPIPTTGT